MRKLLIVCASLAALSAPAFAGSCPSLVHKIDEAMKTAQLSEEDKTKVMTLRNTGEEQHKSGKHAESVATLTEALAALGM